MQGFDVNHLSVHRQSGLPLRWLVILSGLNSAISPSFDYLRGFSFILCFLWFLPVFFFFCCQLIMFKQIGLLVGFFRDSHTVILTGSFHGARSIRISRTAIPIIIGPCVLRVFEKAWRKTIILVARLLANHFRNQRTVASIMSQRRLSTSQDIVAGKSHLSPRS